ncbi:UNVERIFIED_CONTAM: Transportin-1 [Siphonaria sp. JEL0065]|nr:Transportin-1 [Siphonaria sp. JEL0065]
MAFVPDQNVLNQLVDALSKTQHPDNAVQQQVQQYLSQFGQNPLYAHYLALVFATVSVAPEIRRIAGLLVKTVVGSSHQYQRLSQETITFIKQAVFLEIEDAANPALQKTAAIIVTSLVAVDVRHAPDILHSLVLKVDHANASVGEVKSAQFSSHNLTHTSTKKAAFGAIAIVCEDSAQTLDQEASPLLNELLPFFISKFDHPSAKLRSLAISSTNQFAISHSPALIHHLPIYVQGLYRRATDTDKDVIKNVCQGLVLCLEIRPEALQAEMSALIQFMLKCTESGDATVALEACEFWLTFAEQDNLMDHLEPYLDELVRVLLKGMVYSDNDLMTMGPDIEDSHIADRAEDMKPRHAKAKSHASELTDAQKKQLKEQQKAAGHSATADDDSDDDYDDDDDDDEDGANEWTLRKCSAAALDVLSNLYMDAILTPLLPLLKGYLTSPDWKLREAGVLALGAIAEGCINGIEPHLRDLVKFLIQCLTDVKPLVRNITCWTLSRYSAWIVHGPENAFSQMEPNHAELYFHPSLQGLLVMVLDNSKRVQEAACSALATLEEEALEKLNPFLPHILQTLSIAFTKYQHKNLLILYDAVGTLADSVGPALNNPPYIEVLLAPLITKWGIIHDDDRDIFPLLECLSSVAIALGPGFQQMAPPVWERCLRIIQANLHKQVQHKEATAQGHPEAAEEPDMDFVIVALDLLSGVVQGLGTGAMELVTHSNPPIMDVVEFCMKDALSDIRQSGYALLGDLIISCFPVVRPRLEAIFPLIIHQIGRKDEPYEMSVCNNATWATGELAMQLGSDAKPFIGPLLPVLVGIVNAQFDRRYRSLQENAAITLGRFGFVCPNEMAPAMHVFVLGWCSALKDARDNLEKESAFSGMCLMVQANPQGILQHMAYFCDAVTRWTNPSVTMNETFRATLTGYRNALGEAQWAQLSANFPTQIKDKLRARYNL